MLTNYLADTHIHNLIVCDNFSILSLDIDECLGTPCGANEICNNTIGNYTCTCREGFGRQSGPSSDCTGLSLIEILILYLVKIMYLC